MVDGFAYDWYNWSHLKDKFGFGASFSHTFKHTWMNIALKWIQLNDIPAGQSVALWWQPLSTNAEWFGKRLSPKSWFPSDQILHPTTLAHLKREKIATKPPNRSICRSTPSIRLYVAIMLVQRTSVSPPLPRRGKDLCSRRCIFPCGERQ